MTALPPPKQSDDSNQLPRAADMLEPLSLKVSGTCHVPVPDTEARLSVPLHASLAEARVHRLGQTSSF